MKRGGQKARRPPDELVGRADKQIDDSLLVRWFDNKDVYQRDHDL